jgi:DHA1 family inner membrane transport protein
MVGAGLAALGLLIAMITQARAKKIGLLVGRDAIAAHEHTVVD